MTPPSSVFSLFGGNINRKRNNIQIYSNRLCLKLRNTLISVKPRRMVPANLNTTILNLAVDCLRKKREMRAAMRENGSLWKEVKALGKMSD